MVRAISRPNLVTPAIHSRNADGVLVRLGAAVGEEEGIDVTGCDLAELHGQARAYFRGHERISIGKDCGLFLDRSDHTLVAVPDVDAHQLAIEVDEALVVRR